MLRGGFEASTESCWTSGKGFHWERWLCKVIVHCLSLFTKLHNALKITNISFIFPVLLRVIQKSKHLPAVWKALVCSESFVFNNSIRICRTKYNSKYNLRTRVFLIIIQEVLFSKQNVNCNFCFLVENIQNMDLIDIIQSKNFTENKSDE